MKKIQWILILCCLLLGLSIGTHASAQEQYVYDDAELLSGAEEAELHAFAMRLQNDWQMNFLIVTTDDTAGDSAKEYADDFYDEKFPEEDEEDGILYLIDLEHRELYLSTSGVATRYLTDERIEQILEKAYASAADGDYYGTFAAYLHETEEYLKQGIPENQYDYDTETGERDFYEKPKRLTLGEFLFALIAALAAAGITAGVIVGKYQLRFEDFHYDAYTDSEIQFSEKTDRLVNTFVTHRRIPKNQNHGGSGGGSRSSVHTSSSGRSHGGGGRSF